MDFHLQVVLCVLYHISVNNSQFHAKHILINNINYLTNYINRSNK